MKIGKGVSESGRVSTPQRSPLSISGPLSELTVDKSRHHTMNFWGPNLTSECGLSTVGSGFSRTQAGGGLNFT